MNDIQTEVNFLEWFDHYFKPKLLAGRNNNSLLQKETMHISQKTKTDNSLLQKEKEVIKNSFRPMPSSKTSSTDTLVTKRISLISQNNIPTPKNQTLTTFDPCHAPSLTITDNSITTQILMPINNTSHTSHTPNTPNTITKDKNTSHPISNFPCTKTHSRELSDNSYTRQILMPINNPNQQNNKKQTILSQYGQINTIKKNKKDKKKLKEEKEDIGSPTKIGSPIKCNKDKKKKDIVDL